MKYTIILLLFSCALWGQTGIYKGTFGIAEYNLSIKEDSTYDFVVYTLPQKLTSLGKWKYMSNKIYLFSIEHNESGEKINNWTYKFEGKEGFKIKDNKIFFHDTDLNKIIKLKKVRPTR